MVSKTKITFAIPENLKSELQARVIKNGYGLRGKSKWVSEAVESFLELKDFLDLIGYSDEMHGFDQVETVVIEYSLKMKLDKAIVDIRKEYPTIEGVKSRILRTAILQRLLRS
jgi:metal-responsive CopG/Arc/MetJ family transcriptional regulator